MRYKHLLSEEQLDELRMNPRSLQNFASSPEAEGIRAGFEAELIFTGLGGAGDDYDSEPDYDYDERAHSISDVVEFFSNDDQGMGLSERGRDRLQGSLDEAYFEWADDQLIRDFNFDAHTLIQDYMMENDEFDMDQAIQDAIEELGLDEELEKAAFEIAETPKSADRLALSKTNSTYERAYEKYIEARDAAEERLNDEAEQHLNDQDGIYDSALENFRENWEYPDTGDWLSDAGLRWMSDVANEYNLDWPYWTQQDSPNGEYDYGNAEMLAQSLSKAMGVKARASGGYHSTRRDDVTWIFEPDSSLDPDESDNMPVEVVSPPMPLNDCLKAIENFFTWAEDNGAYTNDSTGFHMGVSLPHTGGKTDFIKLALFLGDEHVLREFGRISNTYAEAAMKKIRAKVGSSHNQEQIAGALELMRHNLIELATKQLKIVGMEGFGKYTSINPHLGGDGNGYIEFRSAGGTNYFEDIDKLKNTLLRYAKAMKIASDPSAERKEYYKKLYKLISANGDTSLDLFARFATGSISKEELKKQWAETALKKEVPGYGAKGRWKLYNRDTSEAVPGEEYSGYTEEEAWERAKASVSPGSSLEGFKKAYTFIDMDKPGHWQLVDTNTQEVVDTIEARNRGDAMDKFYHNWSNSERWKDMEVKRALDLDSKEPEPKLSRRAELAKRIKQPKSRTGTGRYEIVDRRTGQVVTQYRATDADDARDGFNNWLRNQGMPTDTENYGYRPEQSVNDVEMNVSQNFQDPANYNGRWEILNPDGELISHVTGNLEDAENARRQVMFRYENPTGVTARPAPLQARQSINPGQARSDNGVPVWELFDRMTGHTLHTLADHTEQEAHREAMAWLRSYGAEDPSTYSERFGVRPKPATPGSTSWRDQLAQTIRDSAPRGNFELYIHNSPDEVFHTMNNVTAEELRNYIEQQEQGGMPPGFLRVRQVNESIADTEWERIVESMIKPVGRLGQ